MYVMLSYGLSDKIGVVVCYSRFETCVTIVASNLHLYCDKNFTA